MNAKTETKSFNIAMLSGIATTCAWGAGKTLKALLFLPMDDQSLIRIPLVLLCMATALVCVVIAASVVGSK